MKSEIAFSRLRLSTAEDIAELKECIACSVLDLSHNSLDGAEVLSVLGSMVNLHVLVLQGNPIVRKTKDYRWVLVDFTALSRGLREHIFLRFCSFPLLGSQ